MNNSEIILYTTEDGLTKIQLKTEDGTVWLTQDEIAKLFGKTRSTIVEHIQNIFYEKELEEGAVCRNFRRTASDQYLYRVTKGAFSRSFDTWKN